MANVHSRLVTRDYLRNLTADAFADEAGEIVGDVNYVHPFREGNGRTQALYLEQLARNAGHAIDLRRITRDDWLVASKAAHTRQFDPLSDCIRDAIASPRMTVKRRVRRRRSPKH